MLFTSRDGRRSGFVRIGTDITRMLLWPAWMIVSSVYVYELNTLSRCAASRVNARNPLGASVTRVLLAARTTALPRSCSFFLSHEKCSVSAIGRAPITISARPSRIGRTSVSISRASY